MDELYRRIELLKQAMAEPLTEPKEEVETADDLYEWLLAKLEQRLRKRNSNE